MVEGPGVQPTRVCLERNTQCYKGSLQLANRKKPLRHLIGVSEEFARVAACVKERTLLADSGTMFVWASLADIHGIPGIPEWADWFSKQLDKHKGLVPLLGIGCTSTFASPTAGRFETRGIVSLASKSAAGISSSKLGGSIVVQLVWVVFQEDLRSRTEEFSLSLHPLGCSLFGLEQLFHGHGLVDMVFCSRYLSFATKNHIYAYTKSLGGARLAEYNRASAS